MIPNSERKQCVVWINEAVVAGARKDKACDVVSMSIRTLQNWQINGDVAADKRPDAMRPAPSNKLTPKERETILSVCNETEYANLPAESDCAYFSR